MVALLLMDLFYADLHRGAPPAAALRDAQVTLRGMTGRDLLATTVRWRRDDPEFAAVLADLPDLPPEMLDAYIYADPINWAQFMLIGRAD